MRAGGCQHDSRARSAGQSSASSSPSRRERPTATGQFVSTQQMGFGLAFAIFVDATIVRSVLVPATMKLLGGRNWYFPRFLEWTPRIGIEGAPAPSPAGSEAG